MNIKHQTLAGIAGMLLVVTGCSTTHRNTITQVATIDALLAGVYDGHLSLADLRRQGDFGIGTFESLDGEMILKNGIFYQVKADGTIRLPPLQTRTPFACVTWFTPDIDLPVTNSMTMPSLEKAVHALSPRLNRFCAFRLSGEFNRVKVRSVPAQKKPYPPLAEVTKTQPVFDLENVRGVLIGFRAPPFVQGVNVPGFHMHFLADNRSGGGHVLAFDFKQGRLQADTHHDRLTILLPSENESFDEADMSKDRSRELDRVEKSH